MKHRKSCLKTTTVFAPVLHQLETVTLRKTLENMIAFVLGALKNVGQEMFSNHAIPFNSVIMVVLINLLHDSVWKVMYGS